MGVDIAPLFVSPRTIESPADTVLLKGSTLIRRFFPT
jgi:hypothetical protein